MKTRKRTLYIVIYLVVFEVFIGVLEYFIGVRSFIPSVREAVAGQNPFGFNGLLYYSRVSGLSSNSSVFAIKIMVSLMMLQFLGPRNKKEGFFLYGFLGVGLLLTFTRSVYVALAAFFLMINYKRIIRAVFRFLRGKAKWIYFAVISIFISGIIFLISKLDVLLQQMNRGMKKVDLSSRDSVFQRFSDFFWDNPLLGNGSYKLWIGINGKVFHAHNVFMQIMTTNGVLIGSMYFLMVLININKYNINYIIPILIISLFQYAIFWGISFVDLFFFSFLFMTQNPNFCKTNDSLKEA
ncbi:MAG: O-antigen ligase family protein [Flagellimonas sp.]